MSHTEVLEHDWFRPLHVPSSLLSHRDSSAEKWRQSSGGRTRGCSREWCRDRWTPVDCPSSSPTECERGDSECNPPRPCPLTRHPLNKPSQMLYPQRRRAVHLRMRLPKPPRAHPQVCPRLATHPERSASRHRLPHQPRRTPHHRRSGHRKRRPLREHHRPRKADAGHRHSRPPPRRKVTSSRPALSP